MIKSRYKSEGYVSTDIVIEDFMISILSTGGILKFDNGEMWFEDGVFMIDMEFTGKIKKYKKLNNALKYFY